MVEFQALGVGGVEKKINGDFQVSSNPLHLCM